jgi:hypothetical protein
MNVSDVIDGIFKLLKANFATIAVIVGCLVIPFQILAAFLQRNNLGGQSILHAINDPSTTTRSQSSSYTGALITFGVNILVLPLVGGAVAKVVAVSYTGGSLGPWDALRAAFRRFGSLYAAWFTWHPVELIGLALCVFPGLIIMTLFLMVAPVIVIEDLSFWQGIKRSQTLASRRLWPTMGVMLLAGLIASVIGQVLSFAPDSIAFLIGLHWGWLLLGLASALTALIVTPIAAITATLLYFDARIRTEGFDLEVIAAGLAR